MEAHEHHDPGYDDWFDEPEAPTETQSDANRGVYEDAEEVWVLPEEEDPSSHGQREIVIAGRTLTMTQAAIIGLSLLAVIFAILAAAGVFSGKASAPPVTLPTTHIKKTQPTTTPVTTPTVQAPSQTLKPGDTGSQVKVLQKALASLHFSPGTPDGDYGPSTTNAVQRFQIAKGLTEDGVVGPATLAALQKALS
jgi:peptidoglycan hydrolase-like protein with peptidoglycan-binding domain